MITKQFLYESNEQLKEKLLDLDSTKSILIQIFTNQFLPEEAVELASKLQKISPNAQIIGTSVSGVIYNGEQYENQTLIVVEQYDKTMVSTHLLSLEKQTHGRICNEIHKSIGGGKPSLLRLFIGAYYDYSHQIIEKLNKLRPELKIVGGMAGEIQPAPTNSPFVFDDKQALANGLVFCTLTNEKLMVYGRINTAHETLEQVYTITDTRERAILSIENEPAKQWLERNFGVLSTKQFKTWEEIAQNDPLVRLQLALDDHKRSIRYIHYDEAKDEITQYFSRLSKGTKFRISYTSPSKCAEESIESCEEISNTPIEQLFCYSCLFRKLYLRNCAQWELSAFHRNPVNGVFLLGEFGYNEEGNSLLNGSCVLSGVAEYEHYMNVDKSCLETFEEIRHEDEKLMDFITRKQSESYSSEHQKILEEMIATENSHITSPYQRFNIGVPVGSLSQYETDKDKLHFNKLCMVRVENADVLMGQNGQIGYYSHLKLILDQLKIEHPKVEKLENFHFYFIKTDTFLVACNQSIESDLFTKYITKLQMRCDEIQKYQTKVPFLLRFVLVRNHSFLLERAYSLMENCKNSQLHIIKDEHYEDVELTHVSDSLTDELNCIKLIRYAIENNKVIPYYQGLYNNQTGKIDRYEALMRLYDPDGKVYTPNYFMEISKKYRLYLDLNLKMFEAVLDDFSKIDCNVSINLSVHDILSPRFCQYMRQALSKFHKPSNITFELLEDEYIANLDGIQDFIKEVRSYGAKIAIDDFGSGYSNLLEIVKVRPDYIKIDGQIIGDVEKFEENEYILEAVSLLGNRLSIDLVAEFVDTAAIQKRIEAHDIYYSQGYFFSKPRHFSEIFFEVSEKYRKKENHTLIDIEMPLCDYNDEELGMNKDSDFFNAIQVLTSDIIFRFNLLTKQLRHFHAENENIKIPSILEKFPQSILNSGVIAEEDISVLLDSVYLMRQGIEKACYFRMYTTNNTPHWYRLDYKLVLDKRNVPIEVIGKLTNIQQQRDLEERINIDTMTRCLRKEAFESLTAEYMIKNPKGTGFLYIIDLDNFKSVNDNLGHQFGDGVLKSVGDKLHTLFRNEDLIGRIGGDEFMVMLRGTDDLEIAKRKANEILTALDATYAGKTQSYRVSASIGFAQYPKHGNNFQTLYDHADVALFDAKNRGKNGFVIYHETLSKGTMENTLPFEIANRTLSQHYDSQIVEKIFNLLFETKEFDISLQAVLELLGNRFDVSRCYIFEQHNTIVDTYTNTYEWCANGIQEEKWRLDSVPLELFQEFFDQSNGDGILYCNDLSLLNNEEGRAIMESQGIKSFLHTYVQSNGSTSYVLGVDDCDNSRVWTPIEISTISQASKIIAQFLCYKRAVQDLENIANERLVVLNSLNYYAYIIDRNTHELTYFNDYTKKVVPNIALGQCCYEVIRQKISPCDDCPLLKMKESGVTENQSIIYDTKLGDKLLAMSTLQPSFAGRECGCITAINLENINDLDTKE